MPNETHLNDLKAQIANKNLVIIAGTGVSVAACGNQEIENYKVATWPGLLKHGLARCTANGSMPEEEAELFAKQVNLVKTNLLIMVAEQVSQSFRKRREGDYKLWLQETVGRLEPIHPEILLALHAIPSILATLNYDDLIEKATHRKPYHWLERDVDKVEAILRGEITDGVLHLHGYFDSPDSLVLGWESYTRVRTDNHIQAVMRDFATSKTMLFVGCGATLEDPNFSCLLEWAGNALQHATHRHYYLCMQKELSAKQQDLRNAPWLNPLAYGEDYPDLVPFLQSLIPDSITTPTPPVRGPTVPAFDFARYADAIHGRYNRARLESIEMTGGQYRQIELMKVFIPQNVRECQEYLPTVLELP